MEKFDLQTKLNDRTTSSLYFLDRCLTQIHKGGTDASYSRSIYILVSYSVEMTLKTLLARVGYQSFEFRTHNLEFLFTLLKRKGVQTGITSIKRQTSGGFIEYLVTFDDEEFMRVQDFVDVRYDFDKDALRDLDPNESELLQRNVKKLLAILKNCVEKPK